MDRMVKPRKWQGKSVAAPGIYTDMPMSAYHSAKAAIEPSISSTGLRTIFNKSPKHYWSTSPYNPERIEQDETDALILGRAAHHLILGQDEFQKFFTVRPATVNGETWHSNKTICKAWTAKQEGLGLTILTQTQLDHVVGMAKSLAGEPLVKAGILNGEIEQSYFWKDPATGIWLKIRPDANPNNGTDYVDMKATTSVQKHDLERTIFDFGYHQQGALVGEGCRNIFQDATRHFSFSLVFVENKPPYCVRVVTLSDKLISLGARANRAAINTFAECMKTKHWPGPGGDQEDAMYIDIPEWAVKDNERRLSQASVQPGAQK